MHSANVDLVRSIYAAWEREDWAWVDWANPDLEYKMVDGVSPGAWVGVEGMREAFREFLGAWADWGVVADDYLELVDGRVLVSFHFTGHGKASGVDMAKLHTNGATVLEVGAGRIKSIIQHLVRDDALADLGIKPEEPRDDR